MNVEKAVEKILSPVKYASDFLQIAEIKRTNKVPVNKSQTGYGSKIPTGWMLRCVGSKRLFRVYAICYSNVASHYILRKDGERLFLHDYDFPCN